MLFEEEIKVCEVSKGGRVTLKPNFSDYSEIFKGEKPENVFTVISECLENREPAWFIISSDKNPRKAKFTLISSGKLSFSEELARAYRDKAEEDKEIADEFSWVSEQLFEQDDQEG